MWLFEARQHPATPFPITLLPLQVQLQFCDSNCDWQLEPKVRLDNCNKGAFFGHLAKGANSFIMSWPQSSANPARARPSPLHRCIRTDGIGKSKRKCIIFSLFILHFRLGVSQSSGEKHKQWQKQVRSSICLFNDSSSERKRETKRAQDIEEHKVQGKASKIWWRGNATIVVELNKFEVNYANTVKVL